MKWISVIVLAIIGVLAAIVAIEYFTVSIHALPSILGPHHGRGHYHKRGAIAAVIAFVALVAAGFLAYRITRSSRTQASMPAGTVDENQSAGQILSSDQGGSVQE
jgi:uncharacterized membrane protein YidH (DUF202 family)